MILQAGREPSASNRAAVKKCSAFVCWSYVATQKQAIESSKQTQDIKNQTDADGKFDKISETDASELVSVALEDLRLHESDSMDVDGEEKESALKETDEMETIELLESLTDENQVQSSSASPQESCQLFPPGRILHMVGLPAAESNTSGQAAPEEVVTLYETPQHLYSKIRLVRSMIREHYMLKYIKTLELLIDKLAKQNFDNQLDIL
jgi:hypothetical protein